MKDIEGILDMTVREAIKSSAIVYINKDGFGVGYLAINGKEIKGKHGVELVAATNDWRRKPVRLKVDLMPCIPTFNNEDNDEDKEVADE